ncbi:MAG: hypothetical protein H5T46_03745 [Archaeoglobi archaeon]|nr:hypothetical protein [Candidatus Mnemosynella sp.]
MQKLKHLLEHWIEHSREHTRKYEEWAEKLKNENPEISEILRKASERFREGERLLEEAIRNMED